MVRSQDITPGISEGSLECSGRMCGGSLVTHLRGSHVLYDAPDHHDADLILKLYDLRRETVMRESRNSINADFWPRNREEALAVTGKDHPLNVAYRQTSGYWEMVYGIARNGIVPADFLVENNAEGLFLFARVEPYVATIREAGFPRAFRNAEWVVANCETAKAMMESLRPYVKQVLAGKR
jgi:hypothetical protein